MKAPPVVPSGYGSASRITSGVLGPDATRSPGLYSGAGGARSDIGSDGAGVAGTAQPDLAELFRPPSSDPPQHQRSSRPRGKRRRGGQPGHPGHTRTLLPVNEVDEVVVLKPDECPSCHAPLAGDDPTPWRHQVIELPPITPVVTEYQWHQLVCAACGEVSRAPWPSGVPSGTYGPRVQATVALCTGAYRLPKRTTQQMMAEVFGVPMSVGTVSQWERAATTVLAAPVEEARTYVHAQKVAHLDETSWRQGAQGAWLWVAVTMWVTVFVVRLSAVGTWLASY